MYEIKSSTRIAIIAILSFIGLTAGSFKTSATPTFYEGDNLTVSYSYFDFTDSTTVTIPVNIDLDSIEDLIDADYELLKIISYGSCASDVDCQLKINNITYTGLSNAYEALYNHMLLNATLSFSDGQTWDLSTVQDDGFSIVSISGSVQCTNNFVLTSSGRVAILANGSTAKIIPVKTASFLKENAYFHINAPGTENLPGKLILQGLNDVHRLTFDGQVTSSINNWSISTNGTNQTQNILIYCQQGTVAVNNVLFKDFVFQSAGGSIVCMYGDANKTGNSTARWEKDLLVSNTEFSHVAHNGIHYSAGIFINNNNASTSGKVRCKSYFYNCSFHDYYQHITIDRDGGGFIRSTTNDRSKAYLENCEFHDNYVWGESVSTQVAGGAAIHWKTSTYTTTCLVAKHCVFTNNNTQNLGGAILNSGQMILDNCSLYGNYSKQGGGAIATIPAVSSIGNIISTTRDGYLDLTIGNGTTIHDNTTDGYGGAIYFRISESRDLNNTRPENKYHMNLTVAEGADVYNNTAVYGGAFALLDMYNYHSGISIEQGGKLRNNYASENGGAIWVGYQPSSTCTNFTGIKVKGGEIYANSADGMGGAFYLDLPESAVAGFDMSGGAVGGNTSSKANSASNGGALYINGGKFIMSGGNMQGNWASYNGGGVYLNGGSFTMQDGTSVGGLISDNIAKDGNGGGLYIKDGLFDMSKGTISGNQAKITSSSNAGRGGGVYISSTADRLFKFTDGVIEDNTADDYGGGIAIDMSSASASLLLGATCSDNTLSLDSNGIPTNVSPVSGAMKLINNISATNGGGISMNGTSKVYMYAGEISGNEANGTGVTGNGGGLYLASAGCYFYLNDGEISSNKANEKGGGVYLSNGTFRLNGGSVGLDDATCNLAKYGAGIYSGGGRTFLTNGTISHNSASVSGGGLYVTGSGNAVQMINGLVASNKAVNDGAGIYLESGTSITMDGGDINGNVANYNGGALYANDATISFQKGTISQNEASNGGGIYLVGGSQMVFEDGVLAYNKAVKSSNTKPDTAYQLMPPDPSIQGIGGGIFVGTGSSAKRTSLSFGGDENLGIFGNEADWGADDIFANGDYTNVNVPDVSEMNLASLVGHADLKWYEDFIDNDTNYDEAFKTGLSTDGSRFRAARDLGGHVYEFTPVQLTSVTNWNDKYIMLSLGYFNCDLVIYRYGLERGESAIFKVYGGPVGNEKSYRVGLTGLGNEYEKQVIKNLPVGSYTVTETTWSWAYNSTQPATREDGITHDLSQTNLFEFHADHRDSGIPIHDESFNTNYLSR